MRTILLSAIFVLGLQNILQAQSLSEIREREDYGDFVSYLASVVYDASSLYQIKRFSLSDVVNVYDDVPELQDTIYTPLVNGNVDIKCRENTIGDIDVFWNDTLIVEVANPFICGDRILLREFWPERPDLLHVFPFFEVFAFDSKNHRVDVDPMVKKKFYKTLIESSDNRNNDGLEVDKSMFMKQRFHRHIAFYNHNNSQFGLLCSCNAVIKSEDECIIREICQEFCGRNGFSRISFELFSWHKKAVSEFHNVLLSHFPRLNLPLIVVNSRIESQRTMRQVPYLEMELLHNYFSCLVDVDNERYMPIGFFKVVDCFVTIIRREIQKDIAIQTFDSLGNSISCIFLKEEMCENNFVIRDDGHIISMRKDNLERSFIIGPDGSIALFSE